MIPYLGMFSLIFVNLYFSYYYIFGAGKGELTWMGYVSIFTAIVISLLLFRYHRARKRQDMKDFNAHIKSDDDRLIK